MKVALVHDDIVQDGGAERLFEAIASIWPNAPIYTSLADWKKLPAAISQNRARPSWMQKIPFGSKFYKLLLPLYPLAFESFNFDDFDIVISSTTRFAKAIITKPKTLHICYINSLPRFLWGEGSQTEYLPKFAKVVLKPLFGWLKRWDLTSSSRVDYFIANSQHVKAKIKKYYGRDAIIIHPFANTDFFKPVKTSNWKLKSQNYFLVVSRLVRWKKIDLAIEAAINLSCNLKIVGTGPDEKRLRGIATKGEIEFLGQVSRENLLRLYQNAKALVVTQEEDFGITAVEAQACGLPVIAYAVGGLREIIVAEKTGIFFRLQSPKSLEDAIIRFNKLKWLVQAIRANSLRFTKADFVEKLKSKVLEYAQKK